ncbi:MAG: GNAT family N-acetyltransferase [Mediterraneibacter gnavus]
MQNCILALEILNFSPKISGGGQKGFGSDAVITFTDFCFTRLNLHKVYLHVFESNKRAIRCYEKAGYKVEGRLVEHHFSNGKYEDVLVMGKTKS